MKSICIIPARLGSSRFPNKPLKRILGKEMIGHVYDNIKNLKDINYVTVATPDKKIMDYMKSINGNSIITKKSHTRASDRTAEALLKIEKKLKTKFDLVIMIQGDEPMVNIKMIKRTISKFKKDKKTKVSNLISKIKSKKDFSNKNIIKVVFDNNLNALYFSRKAIPFSSNNQFGWKQVCIIGFRRDILIKFNKLKESFLEISESVDMNRLIENEINVQLIKIKDITHPVDTKADIKIVEKMMKKINNF